MVSFWPWGSDTTSAASFEKTLSALSLKITTTQKTLDKTRASARRVKVLLVLYLGFAYLVYAIVQLVVVKYGNMGALEWAGMAGGPIVIILARKISGAYFTFRTNSLGKRLKTQQEERAKTIQKLKDATRYDSTMELIEKYGGEKNKEASGTDNKNSTQSQQPSSPTAAPNRTRLPPPPTANIQPRAPPPPPGHSSATGPLSPSLNSLEPGAEFAPNAFSHPPPQPAAPYAAGGPFETHWYDRIFDVLLGEDETLPKNRIVLLCQSCRLVNGQAPPGTHSLAELGVWRCMGCQATNGSVDEGKRIVDEVLRGSEHKDGADDEVQAQIKSEDEAEMVDVSGTGSAATGVERPDGATKRRGQST
ncbi:protein lunapark, putative [Cordyceps militaris CM01]|uniref:Endoplasmic reticulum junction formation protein lunapark n=1 Tax=Cordyceps militaris (strain CM01) TaxID=983644 RepID=G3JPL2_CORMM|nr:protein lunapark, putative [Cordyceps militaris CM01]EGX89061.1 protein lunapark, putative [Cordyceps militaris CM01]